MIACPECGKEMVLRSTTKFLRSDGSPVHFYGCSGWPQCTEVHGADRSGKPLGIPANKATRQARIRAHLAFDELWKTGKMSRRDAYRWLQHAMNLSVNEAHIARFDQAQCEILIGKLAERQRSATRSLWGVPLQS